MAYDPLILVRLGEITLKGLNRGRFVSRLIGNMKRRLAELGSFEIEQSHSRIWIRSAADQALRDRAVMEEAISRLSRVFGIVSLSPALELETDYEQLKSTLLDHAEGLLKGAGAKSFKIDVRRVDKTFPLNSYELCAHWVIFLLRDGRTAVVRIKTRSDFFCRDQGPIYLLHDIVEGANRIAGRHERAGHAFVVRRD